MKNVETHRHEFNRKFNIAELTPLFDRAYEDEDLYLKLLFEPDAITDATVKRQLMFIDIMLKYSLDKVLADKPGIVVEDPHDVVSASLEAADYDLGVAPGTQNVNLFTPPV